MTNEKFTPGEWTAHLGIMEPTFVFIGKEDEYVDGETSVICELHHGIKKEHPGNGIMDFDQTEMRANAHLIAAAPEMYRALEDVCSDCERHSNWEDAHNLGIPVGQPCPCKDCYVEKALKKARGEV